MGSLEECLSWGEAEVDERFAAHVLVPGFVEAHGHTMDSASELMPFVGYYPLSVVRRQQHPGDPQLRGELIDRLKAEDATLPPGEPWWNNGFDPIYFPQLPRLSKRELDQVSTTRPCSSGTRADIWPR